MKCTVRAILSRTPLPLAVLAALGALAALAAGTVGAQEGQAGKGNLDYWLKQAQATQPASAAGTMTTAGGVMATSRSATSQPAGEVSGDRAAREDALPGVIELSDGKVIAGYMYTTRQKDWELFVEADKAIRRIPFLAVLSITANVEEEKTELEWRWKGMGVPEKVFTGRSYPTRSFAWTFHLIDGSSVRGVIKGQPLWIESDGKTNHEGKMPSPRTETTGPLVLHERSKGSMGQKVGDMVYVKRVIVSQRLMQRVADDQKAAGQ